MAKSKDYSKAMEKKLLAIPYAKGKGPHTEALTALAKEWKRSYGTVWQKWYALHGKGNSAKKTPVIKANKRGPKPTATGLGKKRTDAILPMTFKAVEFDSSHMRVDPEEEAAMQKGLEEAIIGPLSSPKRAILFPARLVNRAKQYLTKKHPRNVFSFHTNKADKKYMLLAKKV
jgi:hypothetical protein